MVVLGLASVSWAYEGYAPIATGGTGGTVIHVTNLNDSGAGSLRAAIATSGARQIVFDVGGSICVASELRITSGNVTIAGATAPSPGITLIGSGAYAVLGMNIDDVSGNVIISNLRIRNSGRENLQIWGGGLIVIDHCSFTGALDGALDINSANHVVVSRCLFGGNVEVHKAHGTYVSAHHNLYTWNNRRQPRVFEAGPYWDFRNNVMEYWTNSGTNVLYSDAVNIVNNWYGDPGTYGVCEGGFMALTSDTNVYINGNYSNCGDTIDGSTQITTPNLEPSVTTIAAADVPSAVLGDVGAQPTDAVDQYYIDGGGLTPPAVGSCGGGASGGGGNPGEATFLSPDAKDGYVLESTETSGVGGTFKSTTTYIGDTATKQQYIAVLHFDTSSIPDTATITSATLSMRRLGAYGTPTTLGTLTVDIKNGYYGTSDGLAANDFASASSATNVATLPYPASNGAYASGDLNSSGLAQINKIGVTQFKVRFTLDDDNDGTADYLNIYDTGSPPSLTVVWQ